MTFEPCGPVWLGLWSNPMKEGNALGMIWCGELRQGGIKVS